MKKQTQNKLVLSRVEWTQFPGKPKNEHKLNFDKGFRRCLANLAGPAGILEIGFGKNGTRGGPCGLPADWLKE